MQDRRIIIENPTNSPERYENMQSIGISIQLTVTSFVCLLSYIYKASSSPFSAVVE